MLDSFRLLGSACRAILTDQRHRCDITSGQGDRLKKELIRRDFDLVSFGRGHDSRRDPLGPQALRTSRTHTSQRLVGLGVLVRDPRGKGAGRTSCALCVRGRRAPADQSWAITSSPMASPVHAVEGSIVMVIVATGNQ